MVLLCCARSLALRGGCGDRDIGRQVRGRGFATTRPALVWAIRAGFVDTRRGWGIRRDIPEKMAFRNAVCEEHTARSTDRDCTSSGTRRAIMRSVRPRCQGQPRWRWSRPERRHGIVPAHNGQRPSRLAIVSLTTMKRLRARVFAETYLNQVTGLSQRTMAKGLLD